MSVILLEGGAEFTGQMAVPDRLAIQLAGGSNGRISILPTAAAPNNDHQRAGQNGVNWFKQLGASNVSSVPLIDQASANDPAIVKYLSQSRLVFLLGGLPRYLAQILMQSSGWQAIVSTYQAGAVVAGSSAGAMVLCEYYYDPNSARVMEGLKLIDGFCVLPHYNTFGKSWVAPMSELLPNSVLLGIDEETGVICSISEGIGRVEGKGGITLHCSGKIDKIGPGKKFSLSQLHISNLP